MLRRMLTGGLVAAALSLVLVARANDDTSAEGAGAASTSLRFPRLPLRAAVARVEGEPVVDRDWVDSQVRWANRIFETPGVGFELAGVEPLDASHARLETRRDRHALGDVMEDGVINWFVVESLRDVDDPSRYRQGVHWRPAGHPGKHLVITSSIAGETVLAHELGHFFGNRRHPETPGNIMSYTRGEGVPFFDRTQIWRIRRHARRFLDTGELEPR